MLEDPRGSDDVVAKSARGLVHDESAKHRPDELTQPRDVGGPGAFRPRTSGRLPGWAIPVGAAVLVVAVVGGTYAVTSGDGGEDGNASTDGGGDGAGGNGVAATAFSGPTQFNFDDSSAVGTATVALTCAEGCIVTVEEVTGHSDVVRSWVSAALGHTYTGTDGDYTFQGTTITACEQIGSGDVWTQPELWSAELTVSDGQVAITATLPEFKGSTPNGTCEVSGTQLTFTGTTTS